MATLPVFQSNDQTFQLMQNSWVRVLNPIISNPSVNPTILKNITLKTGSNVINHLLGQKLVGWIVIRQRAEANVYDTQDTCQTPNLTLNLVSSADCVIDLMVF